MLAHRCAGDTLIVLVLLAASAALINLVSYLRSPEFRLRRWTRKWGVQHYAAFAHAEAQGVRLRPVDTVRALGQFRRKVVLRSAALPALLLVVATVLLGRGTSVPVGALVLAAILLLQLNPRQVVAEVVAGIRSDARTAAIRGGAHAVMGWVTLLVGVAAIWWSARQSHAGDRVVSWVIPLSSGLALLAAASLATGISKRTLATTQPIRFAQSAVHDDTLFLRSFNDDDMRLRGVDPNVGPLNVFQGLTVRFEELVAFLVSKESPLVAIGKPGELLPQLGAVRTYVSDDEWQSAVEATAKRVGSIVLVAGVTDGLEWELSHLRGWGLAQKATILLPPVDEAQAWNRLHRVLRQLGIDFDEVAGEKETGAWLGVLLRTVTAIGIDDEGQPCFYVSDHRDWVSFAATIAISQQIVRQQRMPPEHGTMAEMLGLPVRESVLTPVAAQSVDPLALDDFSDEARDTVDQARGLAEVSAVTVGAEHLLVALLASDHEATDALRALGIDLPALRSEADAQLRDRVASQGEPLA